jgi:hypothetical protein
VDRDSIIKKRRIGISLIGLTLPYYCACPKQGTGLLTKKISQFLFLVVEDILILYPSYRTRKKNHAPFPGKNLFIAFYDGSDFILTNKTTILLHRYFFRLIYVYYSVI